MHYAIFGVTTIIYAAVVFYLCYLRGNITFKARSPLLTHVGIFFLYLDTIATIEIYSGSEDKPTWDDHCKINVMKTQVIYIGFVMAFFMRMYRMYKIYGSYNNFLK